jgi:hypothetical protein
VRRNTQAQEAAARAAQPPPPSVSPTPIAGPAVPAQTTLPDPTTPVAVPSFVSSTGLPNFGSSNLLAQTSVPGTTAGLSNVPGIVSPIQPLLETSTLPATGGNALSVPNITPNLASQSAFTQLFPSIPDISLTAAAPTTSTALAADGGPILASDYLPRYKDGGLAEYRSSVLSGDEYKQGLDSGLAEYRNSVLDGDVQSLKQKIINEIVEKSPRITQEDVSRLQGLDMQELYDLLQQESLEDAWGAVEEFEDRPFRGPGGFLDELFRRDQRPLRELPSPEIPPITPYEIPPEGYYPPEYDEAPPAWPPPVNPFETPLLQVANGGPILGSEYLNAGGPVQYFSNGGALGAGQGVNDPVGDDTSDTPGSVAGQVSAGGDTGPPSFGGIFGPEGFKGFILGQSSGRFATPDPTASQVLGGRTPTPTEAAAFTPEQVANLTDAQVRGILGNQAVLNAVPQSAFASEKAADAQNLINPKNTEINFAIQNELQNPVTGKGFAQGLFNQNNLTGFFVNPQTVGQGFLTQAEGGPILASDYLNAGGPVQYFNEGQGVSAPDYPGEEAGPPTDPGPSVSLGQGQGQGLASGQSATDSFSFDSLVDTALNTLKSGVTSTGVSAAFGPQIGGIFSLATGMNDFAQGVANKNNPDFGKTIGGKLGQYAANKFGLTISANQAYPGDYGYGLDPDKAYSNSTAFSRTISSPSESDYNPDDPLQLQTGGPVQYFQDGGQARTGAFGGVGGEFGGLGFDAGVGTGDTSGAAGGTTEGIDPITAFLTEKYNIPVVGPKSIADALKGIAPTVATSLVPQARLLGGVFSLANNLRNVDEGKENAFTTAFRNATGFDLAGLAKGRIGVESLDNPAEQNSVFSPTFGLQEQGGG